MPGFSPLEDLIVFKHEVHMAANHLEPLRALPPVRQSDAGIPLHVCQGNAAKICIPCAIAALGAPVLQFP
jgi:hypothetical protein